MSRYKLYLYDPRTNILEATTYSYLTQLTGRPMATLASMKFNKYKIKELNCYLADDKTTLQQRRTWYAAEIYPNERWKEVEGTMGLYFISDHGRVKRVDENGEIKKYIMPVRKHPDGTLFVKMKRNGLYQRQFIASLVSQHFLKKPSNDHSIVFHKNLIKTDNYFENLVYMTPEELGRRMGKTARSMPVVKLDRHTKAFIQEYDSVREAARLNHVSHQAISQNCKGKTKTSAGYVFMFSDEYEEQLEKEALMAQ